MKVTSYFVGVKLDPVKLVDLFVNIQEFLRSKDAESCIEFQNILSIHVTLYYFKNDLSDDELKKVRAKLDKVRNNSGHIRISLNGLKYFQSNDIYHISFLEPSNGDG